MFLLTVPLDVNECQTQLRAHYNTNMCQVRITPWDRDNTVGIDKIYTNLSWLRDERTPSGTIKKELDDYTEIFKGHGRVTNPKRMLVYGRPGIGKSTFSQKIAVDWANEEKEALNKFDLLLLIRLQDVCGIKDVPTILEASELLPVDGSISIGSLYDYVLHNQEKVLLVLDGYDEYSAGKSSPIREIWEGKQLRNCHVLITSRPMEGEELMKSSHVQCQIRGFQKKKQVNDFARRFLKSEREIQEFNIYLTNEKLWELAEIPLLLLMLCLIWKNRHHKELPTSKLELHVRFVETLLCHMTLKDPEDPPLHGRNILDGYKKEITAIGKLAFEALLKSSVYVDLNKGTVQSGSVTEKIIRSGLFQFSKLSSANPKKNILFLHKSIQEFLAAWYLMNEAGLDDDEVAAGFQRIDSFGKVLQLKEILKFMCEWSVKGARAVFHLLKSIGEKEGLTGCRFTKTPSLDNLSLYQGVFRDVCLECLISCSASARQEVYPVFISGVDGVVSVNSRNLQKVAAEHLLRSSFLPRYVFFERGNFADFVSILDDVDAVVVTCSALRIKASHFLRMYVVSELQSEHFFLKKEGEKVYLYFSRICRTYCSGYFEMLKDLTSALLESSEEERPIVGVSDSQADVSALRLTEDTRQTVHFSSNCFSLVREVEIFVIWTTEQLKFIRDLLSAISSPQDVVLRHVQVENDAVSHINFTDNLSSLVLDDLTITTKDAVFIASSLCRAPKLYSFKLTDSLLDKDSVGLLAKNLRHIPRLSYLTLSGVGMDHEGCSSLATSLKDVPDLTVLDLSNNQLAQGISELAKQLKNVPRLLHLNLENTNMGEKEATTLAQALSDVSKLRTLQLGGNPLGRGVSVLVKNLVGLSELKQLDLKDVVMKKEEVDAVSAAQQGIVMTSYHVSCVLFCLSFLFLFLVFLLFLVVFSFFSYSGNRFAKLQITYRAG